MLPLPPFCPLFPHTSPCVLVRSFCLSLRNSVFSSLPARLVQAAPRYLPAARAQGGSGQGPVVGPTGISCSHGLGAPLTYDVPNTRLQGVLLLIGIIDFFFLLSLSLSLSSHAFHWSRLPARSFSLFPIPPALYFRISRETGSSRTSSAAFEQLPDPSRDFIRAMRRKEFKSTKRIYVYTNKYDIYKSIY